LKDGGTAETSGFRAVIIGGSLNISWGRNSAIIAGTNNLINKAAHFAYISGDSNVIGGATAGGANSFVLGGSNNVNTNSGNQCGAMGLGNTITSHCSTTCPKKRLMEQPLFVYH